MKSFQLLVLFLATIQIMGCAGNKPMRQTHEQLNAVLWMQTSGEYEAIARQTFSTARVALDLALSDSSWTAAVEQEGAEFSSKPPAIILDVDETVLDNSAFQARMINKNDEYNFKDWGNWIKEAKAPPIAGVLDFLNYAQGQGVEIFYVTNRNVRDEPGTRTNLEQMKFPFNPALDNLLTKKEQPGWESDKTTRRAFVAGNYRVLMLVGDDLNDFVSGVRDVGAEQRREIVQKYSGYWGQKWLILPNPQYGGWEKALFHGVRLKTDKEKLELKYRTLDPLE